MIGRTEGRFLISLSVIAAAVIFIIIGISAADSSSADDLQPGDTFESDTIEGVTLTYLVYNDMYVFLGDGTPMDIGTAETVTIPGTVTHEPTSKTYTVARVNDYAFYWNSSLTNVSIPNTVLAIGESAFEGTQLSELDLNSVVQIGAYAFLGVPITSLTIPNSVTKIYDQAFAYCSNLTSVQFGTGISGFGVGIFMGSPVTTMTVDPGHSSIVAVNNVLMDTTQKIIYMYPTGDTGVYDVPTGVNIIDDYSFYGCSLTGIKLKSSVNTIGDYAFCKCCDLASFDYDKCKGLTIGNYAFSETGLTSVEITDVVTSVGNFAFSSCYSLAEAEINTSGSIGSCLFYDCTALSKVTIGSNVKLTSEAGLYGDVFYGCTSLSTITVDESSLYYSADDNVLYGKIADGTSTQRILLCYPAGKPGTEFTLPLNVQLIGHYAFANSEIKTVSTEYVSSIQDYAFYGCSKLTAATFTTSLITIGTHAFEYCEALDAVTIPANVTTIGNYAFSGCISMRTVHGCANVTSLGYGVFFRCLSLESITINNKDLTIESSSEEKGLFQMCISLNSVTLPSTLTELGYNMFCGCESLESLTIPSKVTVIKGWALSESGLTTVTLPKALTTIESYAFSGCRSLTNIIISDKVTSIGDHAFSECSALTSITIGIAVTTIGDHAFCQSGLTTFTAPNKVATVGEGAFKYCKNLTSASLPGLTAVADELFYGCTSLTSFDIGQNVESIGKESFCGCTSLSSITFNAMNCGALEEDACAFDSTGEFTVTFTDNVLTIPDYLFYSEYQEEGTKVTSVSIGKNVTSIGEHSFAMCTLLGSFTFNSTVYLSDISVADCLQYAGRDVSSGLTVTIGSSVTAIADDMFRFTLDSTCVPNITVLEIGENVAYIGSNAFTGNPFITEIRYNAKACADLSDSAQAFLNCGSSSDGIDVIIGKKVTVIPSYLFYTADPNDSPRVASIITSGLPSVTFKEDIFNDTPYLKEIDVTDSSNAVFSADSFRESTALERLSVGEGKVSFGDSAFYGCTAMIYLFINASECSVEINAFENAGTAGVGIETVFGNKIKSIPANMFYSYHDTDDGIAPKIASVSIGTSVKSIGSYAFYRCSPNEIVLTDNISVINAYAFFGSGAKSLTIGEGVTTIGASAFGNMLDLTSINFNAIGCQDLSSDGSVFCKAGRSSSGISVIFGDNVSKIPGYMFYADGMAESDTPNLSSIDLADAETIGQYAFSNCSSLTSVTVPSTVQSIGTHAFEKCSNIGTINFNAIDCGSLQDIAPFYRAGSSSGLIVKFGDSVSNVPEYMFYGSSITSTVNLFLNKVTTIGQYAFSGLNIMSLTIPDVLTTIGTGAFCECAALVSVTIGVRITSIGRLAFGRCTSLADINFNAKNCGDLTEGSNIFSGCTHDIAVVYGSSVSRIPAYLFSTSLSLNDPKVTSIVISNGVSEVASDAFASCRYVTSLTIGQSVTVLGTMKGLVSLTTLNFNAVKCSDLGHSSNTLSDAGTSGTGFSVTFGSSVSRIPANLFYTDEFGITPKLISISYSGSSVTEIGAYAFAGLSTFNVPVPEGVVTVGDYALYGAVATNMPATIRNIGKYAYSTSGLTAASIPSGVTDIPNGAFSDCTSLSTVYISDTVTSIGSDSFRHCTLLTSIEVDSGNTAYASEDGVLFNKGMTTLILYPSQKPAAEYYVPDGITILSQESFYRCLRLNKLVISSDVSTTSGGAVKECTNLTYITIPNSIGSLTSEDFTGLVFYDSDGTTVLAINDTIGYTFKGTTLIKHITISFNSNGGSDVEPIIEKVGTRINAPESPVKKGYSFAIWQLNGEDYTFTVMPADNITLDAVWTANRYTVTLDRNGGISDVYVQAEYDSKLPSFTAAEKTGYTLKGYFRTAASDEMIINSSGVLLPSIQGISDSSGRWICDSAETFYAQWTVNTYTVTFDSNGGGVPSIESKTVTFDSEYGDLATADRVGYSFAGWYTAKIGGYEIISTSICEIAFDHSLYARWTANVYVVTFDTNSGGTPSMLSKIVTFDSEYGDLATADKVGYTFVGWFTEASKGTKVTNDTICQTPNDHTIYAHWTANVYVVTFDSNSGGTPSMAAKNVTYDGKYGNLPSVSKTGYTFMGWFFDVVGGPQVSDDTICQTPNDHIIYAQWTANSYTVSFDSNRGGTPSMESKKVTYGCPYGTLATVSRTDYEFLGWFTSADGGTEITSDTICRIATVHALYAHWKQLSHSAAFINEGVTFYEFRGVEGTEIVSPQDTPTKSPTADTIFIFDHWDGYTSGMTMPDHDIRFYAVYRTAPREYKATFMNEGSVYAEFSVVYGKTIPMPSTEPTKSEDKDFKYEFEGWYGYYEGIIISSDISFNAVYLSVVKNIEISDGKAVTPATSDDIVKIGADDIASIRSKAKAGEVSSMEIRLNDGSIALDGGAILSLPSASTSASIAFVEDHSILPPEIISKVEGRTVYAISLGETHRFDGTLTVTVKYTLKDGEDPNDLRICYYSSDGIAEEYSCKYDNGTITFTTDHLSYYAVTVDEKVVNSGLPIWLVVILAVGAIIAVSVVLIALKKKGTFD